MNNSDLYAEFARQIVSKALKNTKPYVVGINGCQGSGKSTLACYVSKYIKHNFMLNVLVLSLDDFYLSRADRRRRAQSIHPLFKTRGVPGTHNIERLSATLAALKNRTSPVVLPVFDKGTDDLLPPNQWLTVANSPDIVIIEGWCWGLLPQQDWQLVTPINHLEAHFDQEGIWRQYANKVLADEFAPLYDTTDYWLFLKAPDFDIVKLWRLEQELPLLQKGAYSAMDKQAIDNFVQFFQRLTEHALRTFHQQAHCTWWLDEQRNVKRISLI